MAHRSPARSPHPLALFSLFPYEGNERAARLISHPDNEYNVSALSSSVKALDVGFHLHGKSSTTLATLGRCPDADIYVEGAGISRIQCSFEIDLDTGVVMLYDRSFTRSTQVGGQNAMPFEHARPQRKILVRKNMNTVISMGGERRNLVQFELCWHQDPTQTIKAIKNYDTLPCGRVENPRLARTVDMAPTEPPSRPMTRLHTPGEKHLKMRYVGADRKALGRGQFGIVYKVIDVDSGRLMAVKILDQPTSRSQQAGWEKSVDYALKREVEALSHMNHAHVVDYIASQGWEGQRVEIFMGLKDGTLGSLIEEPEVDAQAIAGCAFPQMLQALHYIASKGIIHRDVKPENILYTRGSGKYQFQLGDFGLCNRAITASTHVGTFLYMAPEMFQEGKQTDKVDVWSLFITMLWILDVEGFRLSLRRCKTPQSVQRAVLLVTSSADSLVSSIREMAIVNPERRASAADMLFKHYDGVGIVTPRNQAPAHINTTRAAPTRLRAVPMKRNIFTTPPHRVQVVRDAQPDRRRQFMRTRREPTG